MTVQGDATPLEPGDEVEITAGAWAGQRVRIAGVMTTALGTYVTFVPARELPADPDGHRPTFVAVPRHLVRPVRH